MMYFKKDVEKVAENLVAGKSTKKSSKFKKTVVLTVIGTTLLGTTAFGYTWAVNNQFSNRLENILAQVTNYKKASDEEIATLKNQLNILKTALGLTGDETLVDIKEAIEEMEGKADNYDAVKAEFDALNESLPPEYQANADTITLAQIAKYIDDLEAEIDDKDAYITALQNMVNTANADTKDTEQAVVDQLNGKYEYTFDENGAVITDETTGEAVTTFTEGVTDDYAVLADEDAIIYNTALEEMQATAVTVPTNNTTKLTKGMVVNLGETYLVKCTDTGTLEIYDYNTGELMNSSTKVGQWGVKYKSGTKVSVMEGSSEFCELVIG